MANAFGKVAVLMGGTSAEREVSLRSGQSILKGLLDAGVDAHAVDFQGDLNQLCELKAFDRVFIALHGPMGEDGTVQAALQMMQLSYTGSGVMASAISMDKFRCKRLWEGCNLLAPKGILVTDADSIHYAAQHLRFPLCVKPSSEGSSYGITKVRQASDLALAVKTAEQFGQVMIEEWVEGREYTVGIIGDQALPSIWIETPREFYDYEAKYVVNTTSYHCPSGLSDQEEGQVQQLAMEAYSVLGCRGWARVDFIRDVQSGQFYLIELNSVPGMTETSLVPKAAAKMGWSFPELVTRILEAS